MRPGIKRDRAADDNDDDDDVPAADAAHRHK